MANIGYLNAKMGIDMSPWATGLDAGVKRTEQFSKEVNRLFASTGRNVTASIEKEKTAWASAMKSLRHEVSQLSGYHPSPQSSDMLKWYALERMNLRRTPAAEFNARRRAMLTTGGIGGMSISSELNQGYADMAAREGGNMKARLGAGLRATIQDSLINAGYRVGGPAGGKLANVFGNMLTSKATLGIAAILGIGVAAMRASSQLNQMAISATNLGISLGDLQKLNALALVSGENFGDMTGNVHRLQQQIAEASRTREKGVFGDLGLDPDKLRLQGTAGSLVTVAEAVMRVEDRMERARLEMELFGRSGAEMEEFLGKLSHGMPNLGVISDKNALAVAELYKDIFGPAGKIANAGRGIGGLFKSGLGMFAQSFYNVSDFLTGKEPGSTVVNLEAEAARKAAPPSKEMLDRQRFKLAAKDLDKLQDKYNNLGRTAEEIARGEWIEKFQPSPQQIAKWDELAASIAYVAKAAASLKFVQDEFKGLQDEIDAMSVKMFGGDELDVRRNKIAQEIENTRGTQDEKNKLRAELAKIDTIREYRDRSKPYEAFNTLKESLPNRIAAVGMNEYQNMRATVDLARNNLLAEHNKWIANNVPAGQYMPFGKIEEINAHNEMVRTKLAEIDATSRWIDQLERVTKLQEDINRVKEIEKGVRTPQQRLVEEALEMQRLMGAVTGFTAETAGKHLAPMIANLARNAVGNFEGLAPALMAGSAEAYNFLHRESRDDVQKQMNQNLLGILAAAGASNELLASIKNALAELEQVGMPN